MILLRIPTAIQPMTGIGGLKYQASDQGRSQEGAQSTCVSQDEFMVHLGQEALY